MHRHNEEPIQIGRLQRHAMDHFYKNGARLPLKAAEQRVERVACIGAGPASLACAAELRQRGFQVTVFDRKPLPGGLNTYGVAEYKLRSADSLREVELVRSLGVEFQVRNIAGEGDLAALEAEFDAVFLGVGLGAMRRLGIPGEEHHAVVDALEFIASYKTGGRGAAGRRVVVVGAGNTAIDAANAAKRLGAEAVYIVYRRGEPHISAFDFEYEHAKQEGVRFLWNTRPKAILANGAGLTAVECAKVHVGEDGSFSEVPDSHFQIECDLVIPAIGQSPLLEFLSKCRGVAVDNGKVAIDRRTGRTKNPKYFAGGDCVNGGREVVDAVADGKRAAIGIAEALATVEAAHV